MAGGTMTGTLPAVLERAVPDASLSLLEQIRELLRAEPNRRLRYETLEELREVIPLLREETVAEEVHEQGGSPTQAAQVLGISAGTVSSLMKRRNNRRLRTPASRLTRTE